jgi:hypothetical protein
MARKGRRGMPKHRVIFCSNLAGHIWGAMSWLGRAVPIQRGEGNGGSHEAQENRLPSWAYIGFTLRRWASAAVWGTYRP